MSLEALREVFDRSLADDAFRRAYLCDPDRALAPYDLTSREQAALESDDVDALVAMGIAPEVALWQSLP
jgi:hypothetical protein